MVHFLSEWIMAQSTFVSVLFSPEMLLILDFDEAFHVQIIDSFISAQCKDGGGWLGDIFFSRKQDIISVYVWISLYQGGASSTNTASAINVAVSILDGESRDSVPKIIFIVTDGRSNEPFETKYEALLAKLKGYYILILGIGQDIYLPELESIASEPDRVMLQPDFLQLSNVDVSEDICTGMNTCFLCFVWGWFWGRNKNRCSYVRRNHAYVGRRQGEAMMGLVCFFSIKWGLSLSAIWTFSASKFVDFIFRYENL